MHRSAFGPWLDFASLKIYPVEINSKKLADIHEDRAIENTILLRDEILLAILAPEIFLPLRPLRVLVPA